MTDNETRRLIKVLMEGNPAWRARDVVSALGDADLVNYASVLRAKAAVLDTGDWLPLLLAEARKRGLGSGLA